MDPLITGARRLRLDLVTGDVQEISRGTDRPGSLTALEQLAADLESAPRLAPSATPPDPAEHDLFLAPGAMAGTGLPGTDRTALIGLTPRGRIGESRCSGPFGAGMRRAGLDLLALTGRAPEPVYVLADADGVRLVPTGGLWGLAPREIVRHLRGRHGPDLLCASIGPAGTRGSSLAAVDAEGHLLTRSGLGGTLGRKGVLAVVCRPQGSVEPADPEAAARIAADYAAALADNPLAGSQVTPPGFAGFIESDLPAGYLSRENFRDTFSSGPMFPGERLEHHLATSRGACPSCPTHCLKSFSTGRGTVLLHQEWLPALGPGIGPAGLAETLQRVRLCLDLGMDPVAAGATATTAREAGSAHTVGEMLRAAAGSDVPGIDPDLARALAEGAEAVGTLLGVPAMTVGGQELPTFDPRPQPGLALAYAVAPTGPRYDTCEHDLDFDPELGMPHAQAEAALLELGPPAPTALLDAERVRRTIRLMLLWSGLDVLEVCPFAATPTRPLTLSSILRLVRAGTGQEISGSQVFELGERRFRLQGRIGRALGRAGWERQLPDRFHDEPVRAGPFTGARLDRAVFAEAADAVAAGIGLNSEPPPIALGGTTTTGETDG
jgi:aldehyde:ferredoxin oxidoreductase